MTTFTWDASDNLLDSHLHGGLTGLNYSTHYTYDADGQVLTATDSLNRTTVYHYDNWGQSWYIEPPAPGNGSPAANQTNNEYDSEGRLVKSRDSANRTTVYVYDAVGNPTRTTDPDGTITQTAYDALGRKTVTTTRGNRVTHYAYNNRGQLASMTDPDGLITYYAYDVFGDVRKIETVYPTPVNGRSSKVSLRVAKSKDFRR